MKLFKRKDIYYIQYSSKRLSLRTSDEYKARLFYDFAQSQYARGEEVNLDLNQLTFIDYYSRFIKFKSDLSKDTLDHYDLSTRLFTDSVGNIFLNNINKYVLKKFSDDCLERGCKPVSVNSYLRSIRAVLNAAYEDGFLFKKFKVNMLKNGHRLPKIFTSSEIDRIILYSTKNDPEMFRVIIFALYTGCRRNEIINLSYSDIHGDFVRIIGKGNKERRVPLHDLALKVCGSGRSTQSIFFQCHPDTYTHRFKKICVKCRIYDRGFHSLRHTAATIMIEKGLKLPVIQKILGHADISTTQIYTEIKNSLLLSEIQKLSPDASQGNDFFNPDWPF